MWSRIWNSKVPIILGLISLVFTIAGFMAGGRDLSDMTVVSGNITVTKGAVDDEFGVTTEAPVLMRVVEMNQYAETSGNSIKTEYSDMRMPSVEVKGHTYYNPGFPSIKNPAFFYGEAVIGDEELIISDELLSKFTFESYIYFDDCYRGDDYTLPENFTDPTNNNLIVRGGMIQSASSSDKVGHVRIRYYTGYPKEGRDFSIYGNIEDGKIGTDSISDIFDKKMSTDDLQRLNEKFSRSNYTVGIVALVLTVLFFGLAVVKVIRYGR